MKKILPLFGILDLIAFSAIFYWVLFETADAPLKVITMASALLGLTLLVSGYLLIRNRKWGIYLNYLQFIPRLTLYGGLSLGFVYSVSDVIGLQLKQNHFLFVVLVVIDFIRLGITIAIHYNDFRNNQSGAQ
ncbi:MAG: hypothetical protein JW761_01520 [Prolixibacteraceae bacterium]|nr:hypothetical protein [Prolixibacteraceae bacterium]